MSFESPINDIWVGEDILLSWYVTTGDPIILRDDIEQGNNALSVMPTTEAILTGSLIRLGDITVEVTDDVAVGSISIPTGTISASIFLNQSAVGKAIGRVVQDVTGWTGEFVLRRRPGAAAVLTKSMAIEDESTGIVSVSIVKADTEDIPAGDYWYSLRRTNSGSEVPIAYGNVTLRAT